MTHHRRILLILVVISILLAGIFAARSRLLPMAVHWLDVGEDPQKADYVMVLGGDVNVRPFVAAALINAGLAPQVILVKAKAGPAVEDGIIPPSYELDRRVLLRRGVPEDKIVILDGQARSTYDEMSALAEFLAPVSEASVTVVTTDFHTRRARWICNRVLGEQARRFSFVSTPCSEFSTESWWQVEKGFLLIVGEYIKLAIYAVWYGSLGWWIIASAVLFMVVVVYRRYRAKAALPFLGAKPGSW